MSDVANSVPTASQRRCEAALYKRGARCSWIVDAHDALEYGNVLWNRNVQTQSTLTVRPGWRCWRRRGRVDPAEVVSEHTEDHEGARGLVANGGGGVIGEEAGKVK